VVDSFLGYGAWNDVECIWILSFLLYKNDRIDYSISIGGRWVCRMPEKEQIMANTPYDDVFRTLLNDCSSLILPLLNEVFGEQYKGEEAIRFSPNEHFLNRQDGEEEKRITDTCFIVVGDETRKYHWECESATDNSILIRIFEYDAQIALDDGRMEENILKVKFPHSAVLSLRAGRRAPDSMKVRIETPGGTIMYNIPVVKMRSYTQEELFAKGLLFLIPFYIFTWEAEFEECEEYEEKLLPLVKEYETIRNRLEELGKDGIINEYTKCTLVDMTNRVLKNIAAKYRRIREGVKDVMGGQILEYEAKSIRNEGRKEGIKEGMKEGKKEERISSIREIMKNLHLTAEQAMSALGIPETEYAEYTGKLLQS